MSPEEEDLTSITTQEEQRLIIVTWFFICPLCLLLTGVLITVIWYGKKAVKDRELALSLNLAMASMVASLFYYSALMFTNNSFVFGWDFTALDYRATAIAEATVQITFFSGHMLYYLSFLFQALSLLPDSNLKFKTNLKNLVYVAVCIGVLSGIAYYFCDVAEQSRKETGHFVNSFVKDFYFSAYMSHEGATGALFLVCVLLALDVTFFLVMSYVYSCSAFRKNEPFVVVNNFVCLGVACVVDWLHLSAILATSQYRWLLCPIDMLTDDLTLFLIFRYNYELYSTICCGCHSVAACCCFGTTADKANANYDQYADAVQEAADQNGNGNADDTQQLL